MDNVTSLCNLVAFWIVMFYFLSIIAERNSIRRDELELSKTKMQLDVVLDPAIMMVLDNIITEAFQEYLFMNIKYQQNLYITAEIEEKMIRGIAVTVGERLAETMQAKLNIYYTGDSITDVIGKKIYMMVTDYVIEYNSTKEQ